MTFHSTHCILVLPACEDSQNGHQLNNLTTKAVPNGVEKSEPMTDLVEGVSVGVVMEGNRNISDSVVALFETNAEQQNSPQNKDIPPNDTSLQNPQANTCK